MSEPTGPEDPNRTLAEPPASDAPPPPRPDAAPAPVRTDPGRLERQTVVMVNDRGRLALLVGLCSLAGVAVGFGLSTLVAGSRPACGNSVAPASMSRTHIERVLPSPQVVVPHIGGFGFHCHHRHCSVNGRHWRVFLDDLDLDVLDDLEELEDLKDLAKIGALVDDDEDVAWLGVDIVTADDGARVIEVADDSPADKAGLRVDDVIVELDGEAVGSASQLVRLVRGAEPGDGVSLRVLRGKAADRSPQTLRAELASAPARAGHARSR